MAHSSHGSDNPRVGEFATHRSTNGALSRKRAAVTSDMPPSERAPINDKFIPQFTVTAELGNLIRSRRKELRMSQADLAGLSGVSQQTIDRIEKAQINHSGRLQDLYNPLGLEFANGEVVPVERDADADPFLGVRRGNAPLFEGIPVFSAVYHEDRLIRLQNAPLSVFRPDPLLYVPDAYGLMYPDTDMDPAFRLGDILLVHPHLQPRPGNDVLVQDGDGSEKEPAFKVRHLLAWEGPEWVVRRFHPAGEERLLLAEWPVRHTIVGKFSRT